MENKEFSKKLEERTKAFAIRIIKLSILLPNSVEGKIIRNQMTKSGTSIGANYREANETIYWLEIIQGLKWPEHQVPESVHNEVNELLAIFTSIGKNLKL